MSIKEEKSKTNNRQSSTQAESPTTGAKTTTQATAIIVGNTAPLHVQSPTTLTSTAESTVQSSAKQLKSHTVTDLSVAKPPRKILFTGGGSGGHVIPNLALIQRIVKISPHTQIYYIGSGGMEKNLLSTYSNVRFIEISPPKFKRSISLSNLTIPFRLLSSIRQCKEILQRISPDIVFTKGGYVGLPVVISAAKLGIPCAGHESDGTLGLAHRLVMGKYDKLFCAFPQKKLPKTSANVVQSGAILRDNITNGNRTKGLTAMKFSGSKPILLVMGGSLGAQSLNEKVVECLPILSQNLDVFLITGKGKNSFAQTNSFHTAEYVNNVEDIYAAATLCITRGGASALAETVACSLPFIAVPLQRASRNEQIANARYYEQRNCGLLLQEEQLTSQTLLNALTTLMQNRQNFIENCEKINTHATTQIADYLLGLITTNK